MLDKSGDHHSTIKTLKQNTQSQVAKLQLKAEAEIELLDTIREYMAKRAEIENQYCKSLEKMSKTLASKKFRRVFGNMPPTALSMTEGQSPAKVAYIAMATLISESEKQARSRGTMSQGIDEDITKVIKEFNKEKTLVSKKLLDYGSRYQVEFAEAYEEFDKAKSTYDKVAKDTENSKRKYEDMLNKPKTAFGALKVMVTGKDVEERKRRWKNNSRKLTDARNDYLLALEAINSLQATYYGGNLQDLMLRLDGSYYPTLTGLLNKYTAMESLVSDGLASSINLIKSKIPEITRERDMGDFLNDYRNIFETPSQFTFEMYPSDDTKLIVVDEVTKVILGQKLGEMIVREEELSVAFETKERELEGLQKMSNVYNATPSFGDASSTANQEQETQMEVSVLRFKLKRLHPKMKLLKDMGVEPIIPVLPNAVPVPDGGALRTKGKAMALYDYDAQNDGELSMREGEELAVVQADNDGWTKVKNTKTGAVGLVPSNYVNLVAVTMLGSISRQVSTLGELPPSTVSSGPHYVQAVYDYDATEDGEISYKAGDQIEVTAADPDEEWWEGKVTRTGQTGSFQILFTQGWEVIQAKGGYSKDGLKRTHSRKSSNAPPTSKARALYDYTATCSTELSLTEGELITILNKNTGSADWWEGEGSHGRGQFPANYVAEDSPTDSTLSRKTTTTLTNRSPLSQNSGVSKMQVKALYDYSAASPGELDITEGDVIQVLDSSDSDWWTGELKGKTGSFPANYVHQI